MSNIDELIPDIKAASKTVAFKWPSVTTEDDMVGLITLRLLKTPASIDKLVEMEVDKRRSSLARVGHQIASGERDDYEVFSGKYLYSVDDVKKLLSAGAIDGSDDSFRVTGMDILNGMIALEKKNPGHSKAIVDRYANRIQPQGKNKMLLSRAIESLTVLMNRASMTKDYDFNNGGRHRNNRQAVNEGDLNYDGEPRFDG